MNSTHNTLTDAVETVEVDTVVKVGGGVLAHTDHFRAVLVAISKAAGARRLLVIPGGGPFADVVRAVDRQYQLSADTAHWMAISAMDQYAYLLSVWLANGMLITERRELASAFADGRVPVLSPSRWMRAADPLPHSWAVTSDSIAAWFAGVVGARRLVLVKPPGATGDHVVDPYFVRALPAHVTPIVIPADRIDALRLTLGAGTALA